MLSELHEHISCHRGLAQGANESEPLHTCGRRLNTVPPVPGRRWDTFESALTTRAVTARAGACQDQVRLTILNRS
jgi:hypothetical protein